MGDLFVYKSMGQYMLFGLSSVVMVLFSMITCHTCQRKGTHLTTIDVSMYGWCLWLMGCFLWLPSENYQIIYLLTSGLLYCAIRNLSVGRKGKDALLMIMTVVVVYVSGVCIMQGLGCVGLFFFSRTLLSSF